VTDIGLLTEGLEQAATGLVQANTELAKLNNLPPNISLTSLENLQRNHFGDRCEVGSSAAASAVVYSVASVASFVASAVRWPAASVAAGPRLYRTGQLEEDCLISLARCWLERARLRLARDLM
jgi:hypothetical protein